MQLSKLPNAPLAEVVFEMRWSAVALAGSPLSIDPNYGPIFDAFSAFAAKVGYGRKLDIVPPYSGIAGSISRRFYQGDAAFPIYQIGHNIYAANNSAEYDWKTFRKMAIDGATAVVGAMPKLHELETKLTHLEIRYIDVFEERLVPVRFGEFLDKGTNIEFDLPQFASVAGVAASGNGRLQIEYNLVNAPGTTFFLDIGSGLRENARVARMETKAVWRGEDAIPPPKIGLFSSRLKDWLEHAHDATSATFKALVDADLYAKFAG